MSEAAPTDMDGDDEMLPQSDAIDSGSGGRDVRRFLVVATAAVATALVAWVVFLVLPASLADLLGLLLAIVVVVLGIRLGRSYADARFPAHTVAEVAVEGPITRDGGGRRLPSAPGSASADDVVEQIEAADEDAGSTALLVKLNTPGGQVVPSDDIRRAAMAFDGPTIAYTTDICASGGYWIASGCDELWARDASVVGSIGVIGSQVNAAELADRLGISYERFAAGKYKDAGTALKELSDDDRAYLQGLIDDFYDHFVERVAEGRGMTPDEIRNTEARVYLGEEAYERGLVDELGTRDDLEAALRARLGTEVVVREFEPRHRLPERFSLGVQSAAYAFGAGVASAVGPDDDFEFDFRL